MNIRPKIPIYLGGSTLDLDKWILENLKYYDWYSKLYPNAQILQGNPLKQRNDNWDKSRLSSSHYTTDDLRRSAYNNYLYTKDYGARLRDLIYWSEQLKGLDKLTDQQIVDLYNNQAQTIRDAREAPQTYKKTGYSGTNRTFRDMFYNRSRQGTDTPLYTIGYLENLDDIEGTSTWQRRMDRYENPFEKDTQEGQLNRTFYINIPGTDRLIKVYKKENGDLGLFPNSPNTHPSSVPQNLLKVNGIQAGQKDDSKSDFWDKLSQGFNKVAPDLIDALRLAGNMHNNERVYNEMKLAIIPNLLLSYHTHRQVVGDEATKLAYYRRAAQGQTKAGLPFTSDADRLIAYMQEARRVGDELRAQGDLADNQRIRETSTESAAHTDANKERDTLVANQNTTELNKAKAAHHQLNALKYSADWTNLDLYLMGMQSKFLLKKATQEAIEDLIKTLQLLENLANDPKIETAYNNLEAEAKKLYPNGEINYLDPRLKEARNKLSSARRKAYIEQYSLLYGKQGAKITKKDTTDKYLYRTSRDIVEHFRKMSKMTDDSRIRTMPKPVKLTSNPKKKLLLGGVAPFTVYRPLGIGGETTTLTSTSTDGIKSSKDTAAKDKLDMIKEMFKAVQSTGLPVDVNVVYRDLNNLFSRALAFGEELSTDDIASIYLQSMLKISNLKYSKENYDKALAVATSNESLNEFAVDASGNYIVQDKEGNLSIAKSLSEIAEKGLNPITNLQLLNLRAYSPNMAFLRGDSLITNIINNGMGINKIGSLIKALAGSLGSTEGKLEGISLVESGKVKAGLQLLANTQGTPDGHYGVTNYTKDLLNQVLAALKYIENMLSPSLKAILEAHGGTKLNIALFLTSQLDYINELTISPLTGKASDKETDGDKNMLPSVAFFNGLGEKDSFIILDKTNDGLKINVISTPITSKGYNTGSITFDKLESSDFGGQLLMNLATMGDSLISSTGRNNIIIDSRIYQTELPIDLEAKRTTGIIKPDLRFLKKIEAADAKLKQMGIDKSDPKNIVTINKVYLENNLPILYTISNNEPTITSEYARFAIVNGVGTEDAFGNNPEFNDAILEISSDKERQLFEAMMQLLGNTKYKLNNGYGIGPISWGETKLYKGTIYIPMVTSNISALAGTGFKAKGEEYNLIEARQLAANAAREMKFNPAGDASNLL